MTPAAALSSSRTFLRGYELCTGNGLPAENGEPNAIVPGIVCLAFSVELAIKSLLMSASQPAHGHQVDVLFNRLPEAYQQAVLSEAIVEPRAFQEQLAAVGNAFVEWRYIYESPGLHSLNEEFLVILSRATSAIAGRYVDATRAKGRGEA